MAQKVSIDKFTEALVNAEGLKDNKELARELGISERQFYKKLAKLKTKIVTLSEKYAKEKALQAVQDLVRSSRKGNARASQIILEMAGAYVPGGSAVNVNLTKNEGVVVLPEKLPVGSPVQALEGRLTPEEMMARDEVPEAEAHTKSEGRENTEEEK
tara:strand:+ start:108 stop:578 length:471 start_codon:yes stop_codon:yes gene_type:complete